MVGLVECEQLGIAKGNGWKMAAVVVCRMEQLRVGALVKSAWGFGGGF